MLKILFFILFYLNTWAYPVQKHYVPIYLTQISGENIGYIEKEIFKEELNHNLNIYGFKLSQNSPYHLDIRIKKFKPYHPTTYDYKEQKAEARYKGKVKLHYKFFEFLNTVFYSGDIDSYYNIEMTGWSKYDANIKVRKHILKELAQRVAKTITNHSKFLKKHYVPEQSIEEKKDKELLRTGENFDFDKGIKNADDLGKDISWSRAYGKDDLHLFELKNHTKCSLYKDINYEDIDLDFIKNSKLSSKDLLVSDYDEEFKKGDIILCKTSDGNYVKMQLLDVIPQNDSQKDILYFRWKLYK